MNYGIHVIKNPAGTYSFVGTLPADLGDVVTADRAAIYGNRTLDKRGPNNEIQMIKFPVFHSRANAILHADSRGYEVKPNL
jgi:hypothetical protein